MTSGNFHSVEIASIIVDRAGRQRKALTEIPLLAKSISDVGLINPLLIQRETHELITGERRLEAVRSLGWTHVACQYQDEIDPLLLKKIELEENIRRENITWQEEVQAVSDYDELMRKLNPGHSAEATAEALGQSTGSISEKLAVAKEIKINPKLAKAERYSIALNTTKRIASRRAESELASFAPEGEERSILNLSFVEWSKTYEGPKFNFIHCDFPYGIDANKQQQGYNTLLHGEYDDSKELYWSLLEAFATYLDNFAQPSCHLMFWFSMKYYTDTIRFLRERTDFVIDDFPLIWLKSDGVGLLPDPQRGPRRIVETALFGHRGDRKIISAVSSGVALPTSSDSHMSEKPVPMLNHFFRMIVDNTTRILDPTCGSGSALRAAEGLAANYVLGLEVNPDFAQRAEIELINSRKMRTIVEAAE